MNSESDSAFNLWVLLLQTRDAVHNARSKELRPYGVSPREAGTIRAILSIGKKATPAKIARWTYRKPHTIAGILMRMQKKGLIKRSKDLEAKNLIRISVSEKGKKAYNHALKRETLHSIFGVLTEEERERLFESLSKIRDAALEETGDTISRPITYK